MKEWIKGHIELFSIAAMVFSGFLWMNGKFSDIDKQFSEVRLELASEIGSVRREINDVRLEISDVRHEIAIVKTVLIMRNIMSSELACQGEPANVE